MKRRGIMIVLSDFRSAPFWQEASIVSRRHDLISIMVCDPLDEHFPPTGIIELEDPETHQVLTAPGWSRRFRNEYHDFWMLQKLTWRRECRKRKIETLEISTVDDPTSQLLHFFNRRKRR